MIDSYLAIANSPLLWVFLIMVAAAFGIMWLTSLEVEPKRYEAGWLRKNYIGFVIAVAALVAVSAIYFYLFGIGVSLSGLVDRLRMAAIDEDTTAEDIRHLGTTVALLMGVLAAAATIIFSIIRVWINERTATATEEGLITDRISKAVEGLGAEKTVKDKDGESTKPNLEVRIGAIYALERIAQDSLRDHIQIMEILCSYVRTNAPCAELLPEVVPDQRAIPPIDIQTIASVLGRRRKLGKDKEISHKFRLDLRNCNLSGVNFEKGDFSATMFHASKFEGAIFNAAKLVGCQMFSTNLRYAIFWDADLTGARLDGTTVSPTNRFNSINRAILHGTCLYDVDMSNVFMASTFKKSATIGNKSTKFDGIEDAELNKILEHLDMRTIGYLTADQKEYPNLDLKGLNFWSPYGQEDGANGQILKEGRAKLHLTGFPYE